jgi:molybdopterin molybdotransferase
LVENALLTLGNFGLKCAMLQYEEALARVLAAVPPAASERIPLNEADHRILAEQILAPIDLPPFDNSAMDGYAVCASDVALAKSNAPVHLRLTGQVAAGENFSGKVAPGTCVRLFTGSPVPPGADAVVMQEDTRVDPANPNEILILASVKPWENVRFHGEDVKRGVPVGKPGDMLSVGRMALLAATGCAQVAVFRRPVVGIVATGSELREPGQPLAPGQIYESNRISLAALVRQAGATPRIYPLVIDVLETTRIALANAFNECDFVITSGGASVGEMDFIKQAFSELGGHLQFWKVAIKPGRPFVFGQFPASKHQPSSVEHKLLFGLPGNPISAFVTFLLLVRPAILRCQGASDVALPSHPGVLAETFENHGERRHFMRARIAPDGKVYSAGLQASHILSSLAPANGLVDVPPRATLQAGATVQVFRWD